MNDQLALVIAFHKKFWALVGESPSLIPQDRSNNRYNLMKEEVEEYYKWVQNNDIENIAKELADILYTVYGTIIEHGLQNVIFDVFEEVHKSNMSKDYHKYKLIKWPNYFKADIKRFFTKENW